jgi:hypothetical protein
MHSHKHGVIDNSKGFDPALPSFPKALQTAGYQTALFGKWHLKSDPAGFDAWEVFDWDVQCWPGASVGLKLDTSTSPLKTEELSQRNSRKRRSSAPREGGAISNLRWHFPSLLNPCQGFRQCFPNRCQAVYFLCSSRCRPLGPQLSPIVLTCARCWRLRLRPLCSAASSWIRTHPLHR